MTLAIGSVFSTLQVVPLILLTLEAWRLRQMPDAALRESNRANGSRAAFGQSEAFLFCWRSISGISWARASSG